MAKNYIRLGKRTKAKGLAALKGKISVRLKLKGKR